MAAGQTIGFIGTGIMGAPMVRRLITAGHTVRVWNRTRAKAAALTEDGAQIADSPRAAAQGAGWVIVMVADGPASDAVIFGDDETEGAAAGMAAGANLIVMSSIPPDTAKRQAASLTERGIGYLDAPVSGGEGGAREGRLAIMAGGARAVFEAAEPIFARLGRATYLGPAGAGSLAKLANQLIVGCTIATVAEALLLVERGGGNAGALADALAGGFADSPILQNHGRRMVAGDFEAGGPVRIQRKDLASAAALAADLGLTLPMLAEALSIYDDLLAGGHGDLDHNAAWLELRRRNRLDT